MDNVSENINWMNLQQIRDEYVKVAQKNEFHIEKYKTALDDLEEIALQINKIRYEQFLKDGIRASFISSILDAQLMKLLSTIRANYRLLTGGFTVECYANIRTSFEIIINIYYNIKYPRKAKKMFLETKHLSCQSMIDCLYEDEKNKSLNMLYAELCHHTHPSIKSISSIYKIKQSTFKDVFLMGISMLYATQLIFLELQKEYINEDQRIQIFQAMDYT